MRVPESAKPGQVKRKVNETSRYNIFFIVGSPLQKAQYSFVHVYTSVINDFLIIKFNFKSVNEEKNLPDDLSPHRSYKKILFFLDNNKIDNKFLE